MYVNDVRDDFNQDILIFRTSYTNLSTAEILAHLIMYTVLKVSTYMLNAGECDMITDGGDKQLYLNTYNNCTDVG